jgi:hypothetical protein
VIEFDRALLYLVALLAGAVLIDTEDNLRWLARAIFLGALAICLAGFISRAFPDVFEVDPNHAIGRLSFPLSYWNDLGFMAVIGIVIAASLSGDRDEPLWVRAVGAASIPVLVSTLLLTFSRGPIVAGIAGLLVVLVLGRGAGLVAALLATVAPSVWVAVATLDAGALGSDHPRSALAVEQGHDLALVVGAAAAISALVMIVVRAGDRRLPAALHPWLRRTAAVVAVAACATAAAVAVGSGRAQDAIDEFSEGSVQVEHQRERLTKLGNNGRIKHWRIAVDAFEEHPARGAGAGTFATLWDVRRSSNFEVKDAHSLYLETLAELGVVGLALLLALVAMILIALVGGIRAGPRMIYAGLLGASVAWVLEAGVDWVWEMPAVSAWFFLAGGAALARRRSAERRQWSLPPRVLAAGAVLLAAVIPVRVAISEVHLERGRDALASGNCAKAVDSSLASLDTFADRPDAFALLAYCDMKLDRPRLALAMIGQAIELDPHNWEYHYTAAIARAAAGLNPLARARHARRLNPLEPMTTQAIAALAGGDSQSWPQDATGLPLPQL